MISIIQWPELMLRSQAWISHCNYLKSCRLHTYVPYKSNVMIPYGRIRWESPEAFKLTAHPRGDEFSNKKVIYLVIFAITRHCWVGQDAWTMNTHFCKENSSILELRVLYSCEFSWIPTVFVLSHWCSVISCCPVFHPSSSNPCPTIA